MAPVLSFLAGHTARNLFTRRDDSSSDSDSSRPDPSAGSTPPESINNGGIFALFALIGVAFVITGIWFFFWARNGGFYFRNDDWDDYKSTVLRRKGPNGTILSNATKTTKLGGGSVFKDYDDVSTEYTGASHSRLAPSSADTRSTLSGITAGPSDIAAREKRKAKRDKRDREKKDREKEKRKDRKSRKNRKGAEDDGMLPIVDEKAEAEAKDAMRAYRHERPARVGGLNRDGDGSEWDGSTTHGGSTILSGSGASSELLANQQSTPTRSPNKKEREKEHRSRERSSSKKREQSAPRTGGGIRKVYSTADRNESRERDRIRAEAKKLQQEGRSASRRRDFSYQHADSATESNLTRGSESYVSYDEGNNSELGTKSYRHHIPGLSSSSSGAPSSAGGTDVVDYADERRRRRGTGYRRTRDDTIKE